MHGVQTRLALLQVVNINFIKLHQWKVHNSHNSAILRCGLVRSAGTCQRAAGCERRKLRCHHKGDHPQSTMLFRFPSINTCTVALRRSWYRDSVITHDVLSLFDQVQLPNGQVIQVDGAGGDSSMGGDVIDVEVRDVR